MRKYLIGVAVVATALITAAVALAVTQRTFTQNFSATEKGKPTKKPNKPSGTYFSETSQDPANSDLNNQPKQDKFVDDIFPPGAVIDVNVPASCKATDDQIGNSGGSICPVKSKLGGGQALVRLKFNGSPDLKADITAYNCAKDCKPKAGSGVPNKNEIILYVNPHGSNPIVLRGTIQGQKGKTMKLHVPIPVNCVPPGSPPACGANGDARIVKFSLGINKVIKKQSGKPDKAYLTTPKSCPKSKNWVFTIKFHGKDGKVDKLTSKSPCVNQ